MVSSLFDSIWSVYYTLDDFFYDGPRIFIIFMGKPFVRIAQTAPAGFDYTKTTNAFNKITKKKRKEKERKKRIYKLFNSLTPE